MNELETAKILAAALKLAESQTKKEVQKLREELDLRESAFAEKLDKIESTEGPSGEKGDRGFIGQTGSQGVRGEQGILGEQGITGEQGIQGIQGDQGIQGERGILGEQGIQGLQGIQGIQGEEGVQGEQGIKGDQGIQGEQGIQGDQGIEGEQGKIGSRGERGIAGDLGPIGKSGKDGKNGKDGKDGTAGKKGDKGDLGEKGDKGDPGSDADVAPLEKKLNEFSEQVDKRLSKVAFNAAAKGGPAGSGEVKLYRLDDVDYASVRVPTNGQALLWNVAIGKWAAGAVAAGGGDGGGNTASYLQVANANAKFATKAYAAANSYVNSILANTNTFISTKLNTTTFNSALANTNLAITNVKTGLTTTNTSVRLLVSDRLQVANAASIYQTKAVERSALANTNTFISTKLNTTTFNSALANTNSFIKTQLANTNTFIATKVSSANPTTSGLLAHTGRATISTNLTVSGNTVIGKLSANGSLGTSGYALKSNGSTVYWDAVGGGGGATVVSLTTATVSSLTQNDSVVTAVSVGTATSYLQVANAVATFATKLNTSTFNSALANTNAYIAAEASAYDNQYLLTGTTTNATETELLIGGVSRVSVTSGKTMYYTIDIVARRTDTTGGHAAFRLQGVVNNNAGTVTDIGSIFETIIYRSNINYLADARADDTNDSIDVYVTGVAGHTINWRAVITTMEV